MFLNATGSLSALNETTLGPNPVTAVLYKRGPNAEPAPEWETARATWTWGYEFHWITFGLLYLVLAIYSIYSFAKALHLNDKISRNLSCVIFSLLIFFGITRAIYLFTSPYGYPSHFGKKVPLLFSRTLFGLGFPCLTAGFAFIDVVFIEAASGSKVAYSKLRSVKFLSVVITFHFSIVLVVDVLTFFLMKITALYILCVVYFIVVACGSAGRVIYSGCKLIRQNETTQAAIHEFQTRYAPKDSATAPKIDQPESKGIRKVRIIVILTTVTCLAVCLLQSYTIYEIGKETLALQEKPLKPWPYYAYQTFFRLTELAIACTISFSVTPSSSGDSCCKKLCYFSLWKKKRRSYYVSGDDDSPSRSELRQ